MKRFSPALAAFLIVALLPGSLRGQRFAWARSGGGAGIDQTSYVRIGTNGNVLVSGTYSGTASFGTIVLNGQGDLIPFLAEYDSDGNVLSARSGAAFDNRITDGGGNVFKAGYFYGTASFGTNTVVSKGGWDIYLAKYNSAGELLWVRTYGGTDYEGAFALAIDGTGSLYLAGQFWGSLQLGTNLLASQGFSDAFVMKCDASGNVLWARSGGGADYDWARTVACDSGGNVFVAGIIYADAMFGTNILTSGDTIPQGGHATGFVLKYDNQGNLLWARSPVGDAATEAAGLAVDGFGNAYVAGSVGGRARFGDVVLNTGGPYAPFVAKYGPTGNVLWADCGTGFEAEGTCIAIDAQTNIFLGGRFYGASVLGGIVLSSVGSIDAFVAKLAPLPPSQTPPDVVIQPESQTASSGTDIFLWALPTGSQSLSFQWRMNGTNLEGEVRSGIAFLAQAYHSGDYTLVVTNPFGAVTSHVATLIITNPPGVVRPPNDNFDHAFVITTQHYLTNVSDEFATCEPDDPNPSGAGGTLWWKWTAPVTGLAGCLAESASGEGPYLGVFAGLSLANLTRIADKEREDGDSISFYATQGTTYYFCIAPWFGDPEGYVSLEFTGPEPITLKLARDDLVGPQGVLINVIGPYRGRATIESSEDLATWCPVAEAYYPPTAVRDTQAAAGVQRFYRATQH